MGVGRDSFVLMFIPIFHIRSKEKWTCSVDLMEGAGELFNLLLNHIWTTSFIIKEIVGCLHLHTHDMKHAACRMWADAFHKHSNYNQLNLKKSMNFLRFSSFIIELNYFLRSLLKTMLTWNFGKLNMFYEQNAFIQIKL